MFFKSLFSSINIVCSFMFITKYINGNISLFLHFSIVLFVNRKFSLLFVSWFLLGNSMSKMFGFSMASSFWVMILNFSIDFNKSEGVFGYLTGTDSCYCCLEFSEFVYLCFWKLIIVFFSFSMVRYFFINLLANITKSLLFAFFSE